MAPGRLSAALAVLGLLSWVEAAGAQENCVSPAGGGGMDVERTAAGLVSFRPANFVCEGGLRVRATSALLHEGSEIYEFDGDVSFENDEVTLEAESADYYPEQSLIRAEGDVSLLRKGDGTRVSGAESLEYYQATETRDEQLTVRGGRPHAVLPPRGSGDDAPDPDAPAEPYEIDADEIEVDGENFEATGDVLIRRGDLTGGGDEVLYLDGPGQLLLTGDAHLETERYQAVGASILLELEGDEVGGITVRGAAEVTGDDLILRGPHLRLTLRDGVLDRVIARLDADGARTVAADAPLVRPIAISTDFSVEGDSLEIEIPGEVLESVIAIGAARAVSSAAQGFDPETLPEIARVDWIEGDTIEVRFAVPEAPEADPDGPADTTAVTADPATVAPDPATVAPDPATVAADPAADSLEAEPTRPRLESLDARVGARALTRMPAADSAQNGGPTAAVPASEEAADPDTAAAPPCPRRIAVHYVVGEEITILMADGQVDSMTVTGEVSGLHLEPPPSQCAPGAPPPASAPTPTPGGPPTPGTPPPPGSPP